MISLISIFLFIFSADAFSSSANNNIAMYWGQNSVGSQQPLASYCQSNAADIVILSFLYQFPNIQLNFANACEGSFTEAGTLHCPQIAEDIKICQGLGKKVLLSLGGASGAYGFTSEDQGADFATKLWNTFGNSQDQTNRPFDDAVVDGFDFDIENNDQTGYVALGKELRNLFAQDTSKQYYLSAAPQCPYPDQSVGNVLSEVEIDFAFVQFYNNYCSLGPLFNWNTWLDYAQNTSPNKNIKLFLGLPGAPAAAGSGYADPSTVSKYLTSEIMSSPYFGGISLWDAASAWSNVNNGNNFAENMKLILGNEVVVSSSVAIVASTSSTLTSTTSTSTTSTSTTSTSSTSTSSTNVPITTSSEVTTSAVEETTSTSATTTSTSATSTSTSSTTTLTSATSTTTSTSATSTTAVTTSTTIPELSTSENNEVKPATLEKPLSTIIYTPTTLITTPKPTVINGVKTIFTTALTTVKVTTIVAY